MPRPAHVTIVEVGPRDGLQNESAQVTAPSAARMRAGVRGAQPARSTEKARRRSSPLLRVASARRKLPRKRKMTGSAYGARTVGAGATPRTTASTEARSAVTAGGSASLTQYTTAHPKIAASV